jgi:hypothetical protein
VVVALLGVATVLGAVPARAAPPLRVYSDGDCPSATQVSTALNYLLQGSGTTAASDHTVPDLVLAVADEGPRYQVFLADQSRGYVDLKRDCQERARVVAVFAAITMEPPEVTGHSKPLPPQPPRHSALEFRVGAVSDMGVSGSSQPLTFGGELRAILAGQRWGIEFGAGGQAPAGLAWGVYQAKITRFPMDLSLRGALRGAHVVVSASVGPAWAIFRLGGEGAALPVRDDGTRLDLGLRCAASLQVLVGTRVSPFITLQGTVWPRPYAIIVDPVGQVGTTPPVWVGATLGVALTAQ